MRIAVSRLWAILALRVFRVLIALSPTPRALFSCQFMHIQSFLSNTEILEPVFWCLVALGHFLQGCGKAGANREETAQ